MRLSRTLALICAFCIMSFFVDKQAVAKDCTKKGYNNSLKCCTPQCTDYVACKIGITSFPNAYKWWSSPPKGYKKKDQGGKTAPGKKDLLVWNNNVGGGYGHVAYIESVDTKKKTITISETNMDYKCSHRTRSLSYKVKNSKYTVSSDNLYGWLSK